MEEGAEDTCIIEEKKTLLTNFYTNLFTATEKQVTLPKWAELERKFMREDFDELPRIDGPLLRKAISLFKDSKRCAADRVAAEMLSVLDEDLLETLAEAFSRRILNNEDNAIWKAPRDSYHVIRYAYDPRPDKLDDFKRPEEME